MSRNKEHRAAAFGGTVAGSGAEDLDRISSSPAPMMAKNSAYWISPSPFASSG